MSKEAERTQDWIHGSTTSDQRVIIYSAVWGSSHGVVFGGGRCRLVGLSGSSAMASVGPGLSAGQDAGCRWRAGGRRRAAARMRLPGASPGRCRISPLTGKVRP